MIQQVMGQVSQAANANSANNAGGNPADGVQLMQNLLQQFMQGGKSAEPQPTVPKVPETAPFTTNTGNTTTSTTTAPVISTPEAAPLKPATTSSSTLDFVAGEVKKPVVEAPILNAKFVEVVNVLPEKISTETAQVFQTIKIKNNGTQNWPERVFLKRVGGNDEISLPSLRVGQEMQPTLITTAKLTPGTHTAKWIFISRLQFGQVQQFGESFELKFNVEERVSPNFPLPPVLIAAPPKVINYSDSTIDKASILQDLFGGDLEKFIKLVHAKSNWTVEQLADEYVIANFK